MIQATRHTRVVQPLILIVVAFISTSYGAQESKQISATIGSGEKVRVVPVKAQKPHPSEAALCIEILGADDASSTTDFESFTDFAKSRNIFAGWSTVQIRAYEKVQTQTLLDATSAAFEVVGKNVWLLAPPCPG